MIFVVATFVTVLGLIVGAYWLFVGRLEQAEGAELKKRLKQTAETAAPKKSRLLKPLEQFSSVSSLNAWLTTLGRISQPLQRNITQAGLKISVSTLLLSALFLALLAYV